MITQERLKELFDYRDDGNLVWKENKGSRAKVGGIAGSISFYGYMDVRIDKKLHKLHRLIYLYHFGSCPSVIDHIDNNQLNNKISNLRAATVAQNMFNCKTRKDNTTGVKGVGIHKQTGKFRARIRIDNKEMHLGLFDDIEEARNAIYNKRAALHGEFARFE